MDLEDPLVSIYVLVDERWQRKCPPTPRKLGRPLSLSHSEVLTLAILAQWPRFRSERDFHRFADAHLRPYFPNLLSHGQLNRRIRALEPKLKAFQRDLAETLADDSEVYHVLDTTLIPAIVRVRACRKGLFAEQAAFGRCVSKTEWVYGFKVALSVSPEGVSWLSGWPKPIQTSGPSESSWWPPTATTPSLRTRATLLWSGRGTGWRSTGHWLPLLRRRAPGGHGRRRHDDGQQERGSSSRGS